MKYLKKFENKFDLNRDSHKKKFIDRSIILHNNKYKYDKVEYFNARSNVIITCPFHGDFNQMPYNHLMGKGCDKCAREQNRTSLTKTKERFIEDAVEVHGNKYNYDNSVYTNDSTKIKIVCPLHGEFEQVVNHHLNGEGCPSCRTIKFQDTSRNKHTNLFPIRSSKVHNNKYDYSKVIYNNASTKVEIICPTHGSFFQKPSNHLSGKGCPICMQSQGERQVEIYLINSNMLFERQKKFKKCKYKYELPFDFWIEDKNLLIEFDGIQHFQSVDYFGGIDRFEYIKLCDGIKNKFCQENNINLLRIAYFDIKRINEILDIYLS